MSYVKVNQKAFDLIADGMIGNLRASVIALTVFDKVLEDARFSKSLTVRQSIDSLYKAIKLSRKFIMDNDSKYPTIKLTGYYYTLDRLERKLQSYYIAYTDANPSKQTAKQKALLASIKEKQEGQAYAS
tara:strand:- start:987 stop:1373 length:387 start_codon:yes stop_codon:yes gene_type:complete